MDRIGAILRIGVAVFAALIVASVLQAEQPQLTIMRAEADQSPDLAAGKILIQGYNFVSGHETNVAVTLAGETLFIIGIPTATEIMAELPAGYQPGTYLLTVSRGSGSVKNDTFNLAIGAAGPPGPAGQKGETGAQGPQGKQGIPGLQGLPGADGLKGDKGDKGDPGIPGLVARGEWSIGVKDYKQNDVVTNTGSTWRCLAATCAAGIDPSATNVEWELLAASGNAGPEGPQGLQGSQGEQGPIGPMGPQGPQGEQGLPSQGLPPSAILLFATCPTDWGAIVPQPIGVSPLVACEQHPGPDWDAVPYGAISGETGYVRAEGVTPNASFHVNQIDFGSGLSEVDLFLLPDLAWRLVGPTDPYAGSASVALCYVFSYAVLSRAEGARLVKSGADISYTLPDGPHVDFLVGVGGAKFSVKVTRAAVTPYSLQQAQALLASKLRQIALSTASVSDTDRWGRPILHVFARSAEHVTLLREAFDQLDAETRGNTLVYVTQTEGADEFLYQ
jgi:hypothetical protein